jgi:hypothetical protein
VVIGFLVISLTKVFVARLLGLVGQPGLGRVCVVPYFFPFPSDEDHCALGNFQYSRNGLTPFPRYMALHNYISEIYGHFLGLHGIFPALSTVGPLYIQVFLNHVQKKCN